MSTKIERAPVATPAEQATPKTDLDIQGEHCVPHGAKTLGQLSIARLVRQCCGHDRARILA